MLRSMIYFLLASGASLAVLGLLLWRAPRGWQDQDGFHLGEETYQEIDCPAATEQNATVRQKGVSRRKAA